jgi:ribose 5-phosphate isomerase B
MKIAIGSDHAGFEVKEILRKRLEAEGIQVLDVGTHSNASVDYPEYAEKVALAVRDNNVDRGVLVCGTGIGVCITANKVRGIRAAAPWSADTARLSREHNDANVLCLSGKHMDPSLSLELLEIWLKTPFEGGRHQRRIDEIKEMEIKR